MENVKQILDELNDGYKYFAIKKDRCWYKIEFDSFMVKDIERAQNICSELNQIWKNACEWEQADTGENNALLPGGAIDKKYYTLAKKISRTYGHGDFGEEYHICPIDACHTNSTEFHPLFEKPEDAEKYKEGLERKCDLIVVEMVVNAT